MIIYTFLKRFEFSDSFIHHLMIFLLDAGIYPQFCRSLMKGGTQSEKHIKQMRETLSITNFYTEFFDIILIWALHTDYIDYIVYHMRWRTHCLKLIREKKIRYDR